MSHAGAAGQQGLHQPSKTRVCQDHRVLQLEGSGGGSVDENIRDAAETPTLGLPPPGSVRKGHAKFCKRVRWAERRHGHPRRNGRRATLGLACAWLMMYSRSASNSRGLSVWHTAPRPMIAYLAGQGR